jgi:hypothetical protein
MSFGGFPMWRVFFVAVVLVTTLSGCYCHLVETESSLVELREARIYMIDIINKYALELKTSRNLTLNNSYVYRDGEDGILVWLDFYTQDLADVPQARELMVDVVEGFLTRMNADAGLRDLFDGQEFDIEDLYINVEFTSFFGQFVDPLYVGRMELKDREFAAFYSHTALNKWLEQRNSFYMHSEPYEYSKKFVLVEIDARKNKLKEQVEQLKEEARRRRLTDLSNEKNG